MKNDGSFITFLLINLSFYQFIYWHIFMLFTALFHALSQTSKMANVLTFSSASVNIVPSQLILFLNF